MSVVVETNLAWCCKCEMVYIHAEITAPPRAGYKPCPNCDEAETLYPLCTTADSSGRVNFERVKEQVVEEPRGFVDDLQHVLNRYNRENSSSTPDWLLAHYLIQCLEAFDEATRRRTKLYNKT